MDFKRKIWDFFKQKDDIVDHELIKKIGTSITDLNRRAHNLELAVSDLEKTQKSESTAIHVLSEEIKDFSGELEGVKGYVTDMEKVYGFKINTIMKGQNDKK